MSIQQTSGIPEQMISLTTIDQIFVTKTLKIKHDYLNNTSLLAATPQGPSDGLKMRLTVIVLPAGYKVPNNLQLKYLSFSYQIFNLLVIKGTRIR